MPKLIFSNGGYGGQDYTFNFENKGSALFDLKFSSVDKLRFGYYIPNMDQYASQFLQIENCTKPQHTIKVEYRDIERHKYSQLITIFLKDGQDLKFTEAVEVQ
jgi:hypothetical protein